MAATLLIFRGDEIRRVNLTERPVRIGRAPENDIVVEDGDKTVSRHHAELRYEHGHYTLIDLDSQNGIWRDGARVPRATLDPGRPVVLGKVRVELEGPPPRPQRSSARSMFVAASLAILVLVILGVMLFSYRPSPDVPPDETALPIIPATRLLRAERLTRPDPWPVGRARVASPDSVAARLGIVGTREDRAAADAPPQPPLTRAQLALARGDYAEAIDILEQLPESGGATQLLTEARRLRAQHAAGLMRDGMQLEQRGSLETAHRRYLAARAVDPATPEVSEAIARVEDQMRAEGTDAYTRARQYDALGRAAEAIPLYETAVQLLPPHDPNRNTARSRLAELKQSR